MLKLSKQTKSRMSFFYSLKKVSPHHWLALLVAFMSILFLILYTYDVRFSKAATGEFTFVQTDWSGGLDGGVYPAHQLNRTGWTTYSAQDQGVATTTAGQLKIKGDTASSTTDTTDAQFAGTHSQTAVSSNGIVLDFSTPPSWTTTSVDTTVYTTGRAGQKMMDVPDANTIFFHYGDNIGTNSFLGKSTDGGATFSTSTLSAGGSGDPTISAIDANNLFTVSMNFDGVSLYSIKAGKSTDGGSNWSFTTLSSPIGCCHGDISTHDFDLNTVFTAYVENTGTSKNLVFGKTTDAGSSWATSSIANSNAFYGTSVFGVSSSVIYIPYYIYDGSTYSLSVAKSSNGGSSWTITALDSNIESFYGSSVYAADSNNIFISYYHGTNADLKLAKSTNGGSAWATSTIDSAGDRGIWSSLAATDSNTVYISYYDSTNNNLRFASTTNGGSSWDISNITSATPNANAANTSIHALDSNHIYIGYINGAAPRTLKLAKYVGEYNTSGTYTSEIIDAGDFTDWGNVSWNSTIPTGTSVSSVKIRTGSIDMSDATAFSSCDAITSGNDISSNSCVDDGDRYIQYEVALSTTDASATPSLDDITINFQTFSTEATLTFSPFDSTDSANTINSISWTENLPSGTDTKFQMRTAPDSSGSPGTWSDWCGPDNGGSGCSTSTFFTDPNGGETADGVFSDGTDDQWVQTKVTMARTAGSQTPTLSDLTLSYTLTIPSFSDIASTTAETSATITWSTDKQSSSKVVFGPSSSYGSTTPEFDVGTRVTSHEVLLPGILSCSRYHFSVVSRDASANSATSTNNTFVTTGCPGGATIISQTQESITAAGGGTVELLTDSVGMAITVPANFAESDATFQLKKLDKTTVISSLSSPTGLLSIGDHIYDIKALSDTTTTITSFDESITVTFTYSDSDVSGYQESSLQIYRHDGSDWQALTGCSVDTAANTVTCTTTAFSTFGLFGEEEETTTTTATAGGGGGGGALPGTFEKPLGPFGITINSGAKVTNSGIVTLDLKAGSNTDRVVLSDKPNLSGASLINYKPNILWALCQVQTGIVELSGCAEGLYTIYAQFYTKFFQPSDIFSATIEYSKSGIARLEPKPATTPLTPASITAPAQTAISTQIPSEVTPATAAPVLNPDPLDLYRGIYSESVLELQEYLVEKNTGPAARDLAEEAPTTFFGSLTESALAEFQKANGIMPSNGYYGPLTRKFIGR